jgi:hypothetical protein
MREPDGIATSMLKIPGAGRAAVFLAGLAALAAASADAQPISQWRPVAVDDASVTFVDQGRLNRDRADATAWTLRIFAQTQHRPGEIAYLYSIAHERFYCDDGKVETLSVDYYDKDRRLIANVGWSEPAEAVPESIGDLELSGVCQNSYMSDIAFLDLPAAQKYAHDAVLKAINAETPSKSDCEKSHGKLDHCPKSQRPWYLPKL